ncbi:MAG TPA: hypothetical protein VFS17_02820 [Methylophilaceae bacterium]|nr:hypothetical protein [Methylophilaceae bacterium]
MNTRINELVSRIREMQLELEQELDATRQNINYKLVNHKIHFEKSMRAHHRRFKVGLLRYIFTANWRHLVMAPFIYAVFPALLLLDLMASLYHAICFPLLGIPKVRRRDYFAYDRQHLAYLNLLEILNCTYCAYGNGLIGYLREIVGRTEQYWCPIKHARRIQGLHEHYHDFVEFGDAEAYRRELKNLRKIKD